MPKELRIRKTDPLACPHCRNKGHTTGRLLFPPIAWRKLDACVYSFDMGVTEEEADNDPNQKLKFCWPRKTLHAWARGNRIVRVCQEIYDDGKKHDYPFQVRESRLKKDTKAAALSYNIDGNDVQNTSCNTLDLAMRKANILMRVGGY